MIRRIEGIENPERIYLVRDPIVLRLNGAYYLLKHKTSARQAVSLAEKHGGIPIVLDCNLKPAELTFLEEPPWVIYHAPDIRVREIFRVMKRHTLFGMDLTFILRKTTFEELEGLHL